MSKQSIDALYALVERKNLIDQKATWSNGSSTYLEEIRNELEEVRAEIGQNRGPALEEELGDVLWDFLNLVRCLEAEESISLEAVLSRAEQKY
jgi:NTP pyrophosphatase (non-canonical NTP hydrolase)